MNMFLLTKWLMWIGGYIPIAYGMEWKESLNVTVWLLLFSQQSLQIIYPFSQINEQTNSQITQLIHIREVILRVILQPKYLRMNPVRVPVRLQQILLRQLRLQTQDLEGEERFERMQELASEVYEQLGSAINELEQDLEYNPMQFYGITLWPETIR